jgi:hypothetical protein
MRIDKDNPHLEELLNVLNSAGKNALPNTEKALKGAARLVRARWVDFANGGPLKGVEKLKRPSGGYARSIRAEQTGAFEHEIYSEAKVAEWIENGTEELDMKKTHPYGPRSRVAPPVISRKTGKVLREGSSYLIVPFRWGTPKSVGFKNIMPVHIYNRVKKMKKMKTLVSADTSSIKKPTAQTPSKMVGRAQYNTGDYDRFNYVLGTTDFNGMVRSTDETGKNRSGGYFTFRVISSKSPARSWIKPAMPARHVTRAVMEETREDVNALVENGLMEDIRL